MSIYKLGNDQPNIDATAWVAAEASVFGKATLARNVSVWPGAVIRADNEPIHVGENSNVQEGAVIHTDKGFPTMIGDHVTIGHQAMLHGCTVGDGALIGIQAVVLNGAVIGRNCLVGAGALVTEKKVFPDGSLIVGSPAKVLRQLTEEDFARMRANADDYVTRKDFYRSSLEKIA